MNSNASQRENCTPHCQVKMKTIISFFDKRKQDVSVSVVFDYRVWKFFCLTTSCRSSLFEILLSFMSWSSLTQTFLIELEIKNSSSDFEKN